ncbi:hypothetical protein G6F57_022264 [Rhizopus arrhizus]|nr:hypothetical protein G6F57_022264 [Rhizopus arrhizus]
MVQQARAAKGGVSTPACQATAGAGSPVPPLMTRIKISDWTHSSPCRSPAGRLRGTGPGRHRHGHHVVSQRPDPGLQERLRKGQSRHHAGNPE